jgi:competence protein ComEC
LSCGLECEIYNMKEKTVKYVLLFFALVVFLGGVFVYQQVRFGDGKLHVVFCDVGQGDAVYIRTASGKNILIDGGPDDKVLNCLSNHMPFWDKTLSLIVLSHPHADHLTGLISVIDRYSLIYYATEEVKISGILQKKLQDELAVKKITANYLQANDRIVFADQTKLLTFWPDENSLEKYIIASKSANFSLDANGLCLVQLLSYGKFKLLLTGDADISVLNKVEKEIGDIDVLKVSHHGSKTGTNPELLNSTTPELAVISVGKGNRYGHPAKQTLNFLTQFHIKTLRTDQVGDVEIVSDGKSYAINQD